MLAVGRCVKIFKEKEAERAHTSLCEGVNVCLSECIYVWRQTNLFFRLIFKIQFLVDTAALRNSSLFHWFIEARTNL